MDRNRLKEVHQTDLTESRINEDFLDWLKTNGPTWVLVILVAVVVFIGVQRYKQYKASHRNEAWQAFFDARLPGSYEDVANTYEGVGQVASLARLQAAEELLRFVQAGRALDASVTEEHLENSEEEPASEALSEELRTQYLDRADRLYEEVIASDDGSTGFTIHAMNAYNGRGAIAEARGDAEKAREFYLKAAQRVASSFPAQAEVAEERAETAGTYVHNVTLPDAADVERPRPTRQKQTGGSLVDPELLKLIAPDETGT
jgi:predicted negative regulator of RcsB-dependent stress response